MSSYADKIAAAADLCENKTPLSKDSIDRMKPGKAKFAAQIAAQPSTAEGLAIAMDLLDKKDKEIRAFLYEDVLAQRAAAKGEKKSQS